MAQTSARDSQGYPLLMGFCGVAENILEGMPPEIGVPERPGIYINAIGLDLDFHGFYVEDEDGERRSLGAVLLDAALQAAADSGYLPTIDANSYAWALVREENEDSIRMFLDSGFTKHPPLEPRGQGVLLRLPPDRQPAAEQGGARQ
jgi:hypothetical protein